MIQANIKIGSKVKIVDSSYCLCILNGSYKLERNSTGLRKDILTVVAVNVPCPTATSPISEVLGWQNNCILKSDEGDIIFCSGGNIQNTKLIF